MFLQIFMNIQASSLNCVQLKQSSNWCSFFTQNDLKKKKKLKNTITSRFQKNKWAEYAKVKKIKIKKINKKKKQNIYIYIKFKKIKKKIKKYPRSLHYLD